MQISLAEDGIRLQGSLTVETVEKALSQTKPMIGYDTTINIHLDGVAHCDSAGLAFVTAILREARKKRTTITFANIPKQMRDLSRVTGIDGLLAVKAQ